MTTDATVPPPLLAWLFDLGQWRQIPDPFAHAPAGSCDDEIRGLGYIPQAAYPSTGAAVLSVHEQGGAAEVLPRFLVDVCLQGNWGPYLYAADEPSVLMLVAMLAPLAHLELACDRGEGRPYVPTCGDRVALVEKTEKRAAVWSFCKIAEGHEGRHGDGMRRWG